MICDRALTICTLSSGTALQGDLTPVSGHYFKELEVYHSRYWESVQADSRIDRLVCIPFGAEVDAGMYCILDDGHAYKILQAQHGKDEDGLPCCTMSLMRREDFYDPASSD